MRRENLALHPVTGMLGWGVHNQPAGTWSDDTSMALCVLESLLEKGWDLEDQGGRFVRWIYAGHLTAHGKVFDFGGTTRDALRRIRNGESAADAGSFDEDSNGNGSLMRILPAAVYLAGRIDAELAAGLSASSAVTHAHPRSRLGCAIHGLVVSELLAGKDPAGAVAGAARRLEALKAAGALGPGLAGEIPAFARALSPDLAGLPESAIESSGYVVHTLEASLWCLLTSSSFSECVLKAVNLGRDTDTTGAVAGGLAGLHWGEEAIPREWLRELAREDVIRRMAEGLAGVVAQS
jgi:ADP-ribosylglycohydrolase